VQADWQASIEIGQYVLHYKHTLKPTNERSSTLSLVWFAVHQFVGTYGIIFAAPYIAAACFDLLRLFGKSYPMASLYWVLSGKPYFPLQTSLGLLLGWLVGRHFRHRTMIWTWVIPLLYLTYAMFSGSLSRSVVSHYFGWGCRPVNGCLDQITYTLPFYVAVSYSLGALMALNAPERFRRPNPRNFWVYLIIGLLFLAAFCSEVRQAVELLRQGGQWQWVYLQPLIVVAGGAALLFLYSGIVARTKLLRKKRSDDLL
jgi:hypothetical protein